MKIERENITKDIKKLTLMDIDIEDNQDVNKLLMVLEKLTRGDKYYFEFRREDDDFLTDEEIIKYRYEIPEFLQSNGKYEIKGFTDERRFDSVGCLPIDESIYGGIIKFWKYFYALLFFNPAATLGWEEYVEACDKIKPQEYGLGIIQKNYASSVFIKGHDGDNLIFVYGQSYEEALVDEVIKNNS